MRPWRPLLLLLFFPAAAQAHAGPLSDPWLVASFLPLLFVRPRALLPFAGALLALVVALVWPLASYAEASFAAHMAQHMLLIGVAAPLLAISRLAMPLMKGRRTFARPLLMLARPPSAFVVHGAVIWLGHMPALLEWSLDAAWMHALQHFAFVASAALFWWSLLARGRGNAGASALWILGTLIHTGLLGALLTFAPRPLYTSYGFEDQQLAGLLMWIPGGICYLVAGLACVATWLAGRERRPTVAQ
jgi:cytochrome c oxidase assembly factor CtaG